MTKVLGHQDVLNQEIFPKNVRITLRNLEIYLINVFQNTTVYSSAYMSKYLKPVRPI